MLTKDLCLVPRDLGANYYGLFDTRSNCLSGDSMPNLKAPRGRRVGARSFAGGRNSERRDTCYGLGGPPRTKLADLMSN